MPDTNEDNYGSNCITISVGMTDKQVVWFMGFFSTSIFPRRIFFSVVIMNQLDLTPLSCVTCVLVTFACFTQAALRRHIDKNVIWGATGRRCENPHVCESHCYFSWTFVDQISVLKQKDKTGEWGSGGGRGLDQIILLYINTKLWAGFMLTEMGYNKSCFRWML